MAKIREEIDKWQNSLSMMETKVQELQDQLAAAGQSDPDRAALEARLAAAEAKLQALEEAPPAQQTPPSESGAGDPPSQTPNEPPTPPPAPEPAQTRAAKKGWI